MSETFCSRNVTRAAVPQALPLLRATWPGMDLATWQGFVDAFCDDATTLPAITGLFDSAGGLCGLLASHIDHGLCQGRFLAIPLFTVVDIGNSLNPIRAMIEVAADRARENGCDGFEIRLASEQGELLKRLRHLGLQHHASLHSSLTFRVAAGTPAP